MHGFGYARNVGAVSLLNGELMQLVTIDPAGLRLVWNDVREGLDKMPASDWIAEDVYHAIRSSESALVMAYDGEFVGFMVLRRLVAEFSKQVKLHVWLAYNKGDSDILTIGESHLRQLAEQMGAHRITFGSPRPGWAKRYPLVEATYEIPLMKSEQA